jgi:hypothetical protein
MIAVLIFVISLAALIQFGVLSWRAGVLQLASEPFVTESATVAEFQRNLLNTKSFNDVAVYQEICPDLGEVSGPNLRGARLYYRFIQLLGALGTRILPSKDSTRWVEREMALCTRYAAVVVSQRLEHNRVLMAEINFL